MSLTSEKSELKKVQHRFEIAVNNFGRACSGLLANEKAFQAWFAASVMQEFGLSRVYREVHLRKTDLSELVPAFPPDFGKVIGLDGNEVFPDVCVSWSPEVDARHSESRHTSIQNAGNMLCQLAVVSELKVFCSTKSGTSRTDLKKDLIKLSLIRSAYDAACRRDNITGRGLATYLIVLDNLCDQSGTRLKGRGSDYCKEIESEVNRAFEIEPRTNLIWIDENALSPVV